MIRRLIILLLIVGCGPTMQNLTPASEVQPNMAKKEVLKIMGEPIFIEYVGVVEEWHYCETGSSYCFFVVFYFNRRDSKEFPKGKNKVITKHYYLVTKEDTGGEWGSCQKFIKMGNYRMPDEVKEHIEKFNQKIIH